LGVAEFTYEKLENKDGRWEMRDGRWESRIIGCSKNDESYINSAKPIVDSEQISFIVS
jgi:hypothetical protein